MNIPGAAAVVTANAPFYAVFVWKLVTLQAAGTAWFALDNSTNDNRLFEFRKNTVGAGHALNVQRINNAAQFDNLGGLLIGNANPDLTEIIYDGLHLTMYRNGILEFDQDLAGGDLTLDRVTIGGHKQGADPAAQFTNMAVARALLYSTIPSDANRALLVASLRQEYGL